MCETKSTYFSKLTDSYQLAGKQAIARGPYGLQLMYMPPFTWIVEPEM